MGQTAGPTLAVQIGFVAGALGSAGFGLADAVPSRRLFVIAALSGTATNAALGGRVDDGYRSRRWPFRGAVVAVLPKPDWPGSEEPGGLSTCGYLGHMWELYAMWTWTAAFLLASATVSGSSYGSVPIITFAVIAIGGAGGRLAGIWADRFGRPQVAGGSMAVSGVCALVTPVVFGRSALSVGRTAFPRLGYQSGCRFCSVLSHGDGNGTCPCAASARGAFRFREGFRSGQDPSALTS